MAVVAKGAAEVMAVATEMDQVMEVNIFVFVFL